MGNDCTSMESCSKSNEVIVDHNLGQQHQQNNQVKPDEDFYVQKTKPKNVEVSATPPEENFHSNNSN
jgi:hypothetical protein